MSKKLYAVSLSIIILSFFISPYSFSKSKPQIKKRAPAVAGSFYPANKDGLSTLIDRFLENVKTTQVKEDIVAMVAPHAGYTYSGQVAAYGYKELIGENFDTIILIGNGHKEAFDGISVYKHGVWQTPLGDVQIDSDLAEKLIKSNPRIMFRGSAHNYDHILEVQLPFLQKTLKNFKIVPIVFGNQNKDDYKFLAKAILDNIKGKKVLIIASSDLSHYPSYEDSKAADSKTIEGILSGDVAKLEDNISALTKQYIPNAVTFACGDDAIKTAMLVAKGLGATDIKLLGRANSGDVTGGKYHIVGYASIGFFKPLNKGVEMGLNKEEQEKLLEIAQKTVEDYVKHGKKPEFNITDPALNQKLGAFVTLKLNGMLRGCIGRFSPTSIPLYQVVSQMAVAAAVQDPRFPPVTKDELKNITYEISVLSVPEKINSWQDVVLGKHGVIVSDGLNRGVFLPQVATEFNMNREAFLAEICSQKAGLPRDCYKDPKVELQVFTAQVFGKE